VSEKQRAIDDFLDIDWQSISTQFEDAEWYDSESGILEKAVALGKTWAVIPQVDEEDMRTDSPDDFRAFRHLKRLLDASPSISPRDLWWELAVEEAEDRGWSIGTGEHDPTDVYIFETGFPLEECVVMQPDGCIYCNREVIVTPPKNYDSDDELWCRAKQWMDDNGYWPNAFSLSDHGNLNQIDLEEYPTILFVFASYARVAVITAYSHALALEALLENEANEDGEWSEDHSATHALRLPITSDIYEVDDR
jgi:hypothetical protein